MSAYIGASGLTTMKLQQRGFKVGLLLVSLLGADPPQEGTYDSLFSEVSAFNQIREALRWLLSAPVECQVSLG